MILPLILTLTRCLLHHKGYKAICNFLNDKPKITSVATIPPHWKLSKSMTAHIDEILKTGTMAKLEEGLKNKQITATRLFTKIHG